jgi:hypothetical protein
MDRIRMKDGKLIFEVRALIFKWVNDNLFIEVQTKSEENVVTVRAEDIDFIV